MSSDPTQTLNLLSDVIDHAKAAGADAADAVLFDAVTLSAAQRLGHPERLERAESGDLGLRVFVGQRMAIVSSADRKPEMLAAMAERAVAMARAVPDDRFCGLADPEQLARQPSADALDLDDPQEPAADTLIERARTAEEAALAVPGVTNSDGAEAGWRRTAIAMAASNGFRGAYSVTGHSVSASVVAGEGGGMETDYDVSSAVHAADLDDPTDVGRRAGERAVQRLNARKIETAKVPVLFDPRVANSLLRHMAGAINGQSIARGTSFLKDRLGQPVFAPGIRVVDDPLRRRGLRSKPFDGEGVATACRDVIDDGRLTTWLLDLRSARQLGLTSTGHASRGSSAPPAPAATNLYLAPGAVGPEALMREVDRGFYVTQLLGMGVNPVTGDYSRGAAGFWIEGGAFAFPVNEVTIAGNLKDMYRNLTPANDLVFRYGVDAPTVRVDGLTVAGL